MEATDKVLEVPILERKKEGVSTMTTKKRVRIKDLETIEILKQTLGFEDAKYDKLKEIN